MWRLKFLGDQEKLIDTFFKNLVESLFKRGEIIDKNGITRIQ